jgi:hypothetical protein
MRLALRVLLTSMSVAIFAGMLVANGLVLSLSALSGGGIHYKENLAEIGLVSIAYSVPLGAIGGLIALATLRRRSKALPRRRWAGRGVLVGLGVGALGSGLFPLFWGSVDGAALVALPGGLAGALAGGVTGAILSRGLKLEGVDLRQVNG